MRDGIADEAIVEPFATSPAHSMTAVEAASRQVREDRAILGIELRGKIDCIYRIAEH